MGALDCVGGEVARAVVAATNPGALTLIYGALGGPTLQINTLDIFLNKKIQVFCCIHCVLVKAPANEPSKVFTLWHVVMHCSALALMHIWIDRLQPFLLRQYLGSEGQNRQKVFASVMKLIQDGIIKLPSGTTLFNCH